MDLFHRLTRGTVVREEPATVAIHDAAPAFPHISPVIFSLFQPR